MKTQEEIEKLRDDAIEAGDAKKAILLSSLLPIDPEDLRSLPLFYREIGFERFLEEMTETRNKEAAEARIKLQAMGIAV